MPELIFSHGHIESDDLLLVIRPEGTSGKVEPASPVIDRIVGKRVTELTESGRFTFSDGTHVQLVIPKGTDIAIQPTPPANPVGNALWLDLGVSPNLLKRWNGENWVTTGAAATGSTPGQIRDKLQTLIGVDRLHATAVQGLFSGSWRDLADKPVLGVTVRDGGTVDGEGIRILDFGANLTVTVANGIATIAGHAQGTPHPFTPSKANLYDAVKEIIMAAAGIAVTPDDTNNELDISTTSAPPPPLSTNAVYVWSQPTAAVPSALAVGAATGWPSVTVPEPAQNGYMVIAQSAVDADLTSASKGGFDQLPGLTKGANTFIDSGTSYEYWISADLLFPSTIAGRWTFTR